MRGSQKLILTVGDIFLSRNKLLDSHEFPACLLIVASDFHQKSIDCDCAVGIMQLVEVIQGIAEIELWSIIEIIFTLQILLKNLQSSKCSKNSVREISVH